MILSKAEGENATLRVTGLSEAVSSASPNLCVNSSGVLQRTTGGAGIPEAPVDGKQYGRQDAEWTEVTGGGGDSTSRHSYWYGSTFRNGQCPNRMVTL